VFVVDGDWDVVAGGYLAALGQQARIFIGARN
jgi:hypothetical protein